MKRRRTMLLCVTATSMAAAVGCAPPQAVGKVGQPEYTEPDAGSQTDTVDAAPPPVAVDQTPPPDAVKVGKVAVERDAGGLPEFHPDRVGTTAVAPDKKK